TLRLASDAVASIAAVAVPVPVPVPLAVAVAGAVARARGAEPVDLRAVPLDRLRGIEQLQDLLRAALCLRERDREVVVVVRLAPRPGPRELRRRLFEQRKRS